MTRGDIKLSAIRMFAKDADKTARFYEALGYEMIGPNPDDLKKMGFPPLYGGALKRAGCRVRDLSARARMQRKYESDRVHALHSSGEYRESVN